MSLSPKSTIDLNRQPAYDELVTVWQECNVPNWDGYNALPVLPETFANTWRFICALPWDYPLPSVGVEADGHLTLEWYRHSRWILSVSVSPEGDLHYAALFGNSDIRGSEPFVEGISKRLLDLIQDVKAA
jgi:hypothetical protein